MKDFIAISSTVHERVTQPEDPRLGQGLATNGAEHEVANGIAILGYPDDEGVQLSFGRVGAKFGPDEIRKDLYGLQDLQKRGMRL
jgi:arginase family enzyme